MDTREFLESVERIGKRTTYSCPDCNGSMWQIGDGEPLKLRCHVGHSFTGEVLSTGQNRNIETALWTAIRLMEEKVTFSRQLAERKREQSMQDGADVYEREAGALDEQITKLRDIIVSGSATLRFLSE
jgi:two-component system chemotaxis response regulator CheB